MAKKNEKTSKRVASDAGALLRKRYPKIQRWFGYLLVRCNVVPLADMRKIRGALASALTQTADKERRYHPDVPQPVVSKRKTARSLGRLAMGFDDWGIDTRDGASGEPQKQRIPKRVAAGARAKRRPSRQRSKHK